MKANSRRPRARQKKKETGGGGSDTDPNNRASRHEEGPKGVSRKQQAHARGEEKRGEQRGEQRGYDKWRGAACTQSDFGDKCGERNRSEKREVMKREVFSKYS
jgi:hypothetical protein